MRARGRLDSVEAAMATARRTRRAVPISVLTTATSRTVADPDGSLTTTSVPDSRPAATGPGSATLSRPGWDETQSSRHCSAKPGWHGSFPDGLGVGYTRTGRCPGLDRSYFQFSLASILPVPVEETVHVQSAVLHAVEVHRTDRDCARSWPVQFYAVSAVSRRTDWLNQPRLRRAGLLATVHLRASAKPHSGCRSESVTVTVQKSTARAAAARDATWTVALVGDEHKSAANRGFMQFSQSADIVTTFDLTPLAPEPYDGNMTTPEPVYLGGSPDNGCVPELPGWINQDTVTLNAQLSPAIKGEPVQGRFEFIGGPKATVLSSPVSPYVEPDAAGVSAISIPAGVTLQDGESYAWRVAAVVSGNPSGSDGPYVSAWSQYCGFGVDLTPPLQPTVTSAAFPPTGGSATSGTFTFTSSDPVPSCSGCQASGVSEFRYALDGPASAGSEVPATTTDGVASATSPAVYLPAWGNHVLNVEAIDVAGNVSAVDQYSFSANTTTQAPLVYSAQVPPGGVDSGGQPVAVTFSSENATSSTCTPSPCGDDIAGFAYQLNNNQFPVDPAVTPAVVSNGIANLAVSVTPAMVGTNTLYVMAVDANGDESQVDSYSFYVPASDAARLRP